MKLSSKILEEAVEQIAALPGVGKKSAFRLALHFLKKDKAFADRFTQAISTLKEQVFECVECHYISDQEVCEICSNPTRTNDSICVVEDINDVMAIESTQQFNGKYHVLGGVISPMDGIGPLDLHINDLISKVEKHQPSEVILALNPTMDGDTTQFYLYKKLKNFSVEISTLARGVSYGENLEYTDETTLGRSLHQRLPYEKTVKRA
ncbi:MAG: recombination mediator RecR [Flavobacteriales bacterium]|jgi:recombination protein RecR|nr:recombination mediator RecR [Flavobacteriales bacterium]